MFLINKKHQIYNKDNQFFYFQLKNYNNKLKKMLLYF